MIRKKTRVRHARHVYTIESGGYSLRFRNEDQRDVVYNFIIRETSREFAKGQRVGEQRVTDDFGEEIKLGESV